MFGWFGGAGSAQARKDAPKKAIVELRSQLDLLQKRERHLDGLIKDQDNIARKMVGTNKGAARNALKRKKAHEQTLDQTMSQITMLEGQIHTIETANINAATLTAMKNAGKAIKDIHNGIDMTKIDEMMDEMADQRVLANEIGTAITNNPLGDAVDEDELEAEMAELEQEQLDKALLETGSVPVGPSAVNAEPASKAKPTTEEEDEEDELRKLQAEMAS